SFPTRRSSDLGRFGRGGFWRRGRFRLCCSSDSLRSSDGGIESLFSLREVAVARETRVELVELRTRFFELAASDQLIELPDILGLERFLFELDLRFRFRRNNRLDPEERLFFGRRL